VSLPLLLFKTVSDLRSSTTLASGTFPGPIIRASKVGSVGGCSSFPFDFDTSQGDELKVNVLDQLQNNSLDLATSIVRSLVFGMHLER
jgi:hypothetical protein